MKMTYYIIAYDVIILENSMKKYIRWTETEILQKHVGAQQVLAR